MGTFYFFMGIEDGRLAHVTMHGEAEHISDIETVVFGLEDPDTDTIEGLTAKVEKFKLIEHPPLRIGSTRRPSGLMILRSTTPPTGVTRATRSLSTTRIGTVTSRATTTSSSTMSPWRSAARSSWTLARLAP